jgi:hypothetical protein
MRGGGGERHSLSIIRICLPTAWRCCWRAPNAKKYKPELRLEKRTGQQGCFTLWAKGRFTPAQCFTKPDEEFFIALFDI